MKYFIEDTTLTGIADAIRNKKGTTDAIAVKDFPEAINSISGSVEKEAIYIDIWNIDQYFDVADPQWLDWSFGTNYVGFGGYDCDYELCFTAKMDLDFWFNLRVSSSDRCYIYAYCPNKFRDFEFEYENCTADSDVRFVIPVHLSVAKGDSLEARFDTVGAEGESTFVLEEMCVIPAN